MSHSDDFVSTDGDPIRARAIWGSAKTTDPKPVTMSATTPSDGDIPQGDEARAGKNQPTPKERQVVLPAEAPTRGTPNPTDQGRETVGSGHGPSRPLRDEPLL